MLTLVVYLITGYLTFIISLIVSKKMGERILDTTPLSMCVVISMLWFITIPVLIVVVPIATFMVVTASVVDKHVKRG
ncbi:MAG: hypothetical protein RR959_08115 [Erysipelotrichaceae bacterium]